MKYKNLDTKKKIKKRKSNPNLMTTKVELWTLSEWKWKRVVEKGSSQQ